MTLHLLDLAEGNAELRPLPPAVLLLVTNCDQLLWLFLHVPDDDIFKAKLGSFSQQLLALPQHQHRHLFAGLLKLFGTAVLCPLFAALHIGLRMQGRENSYLHEFSETAVLAVEGTWMSDDESGVSVLAVELI
jgi:hypothetical protein